MNATVSKFFSRKLLVALVALFGALMQSGVSHDDPVQLAIVGAVSVAYVVAQSFVDHKQVATLGTAVATGLRVGADASSPSSIAAASSRLSEIERQLGRIELGIAPVTGYQALLDEWHELTAAQRKADDAIPHPAREVGS